MAPNIYCVGIWREDLPDDLIGQHIISIALGRAAKLSIDRLNHPPQSRRNVFCKFLNVHRAYKLFRDKST